MQTARFFHWIGSQLGQLIRAIVAWLAWVFGHLFTWIDSFINGLTSALGVSPSVFTLVMLVLGLLLLYAGLRSLLRRHLFAALIWSALGVVLLGWLIQ